MKRHASLFFVCVGMLAAAGPCSTCHPKEARAYAGTGMANSIGRPRGQSSGAIRRGSTTFSVRSGPLGMTHRVERGGLAAEYPVEWFIGSGHVGRSYLMSIAGRLFQSPFSQYSGRKSWDLSPGFEGGDELDFDRPIPPECLFCHANQARATPFTTNQYESPAVDGPISCERCHGAGEAHATRPSKSNIVNPARLATRRRDAVCEQCHLGGEARIANPGRQLWDYRPGQLLEETLTVYVADRGHENFRVVSHVEQLAASRCAQESGERLWCGSCHNPHADLVAPATHYDARCRECHPSSSLARHSGAKDNCAGCHMPRRRASDGGHTAFTDHRIRARTSGTGDVGTPPVGLRAWREPASGLSERNLGLALISAGERHGSADLLNEGFRHLANVQARFPDDPALLTSLGVVLQRKGARAEAARLFERCAQLEPRDARHRLNLGAVLAELNEPARAIAALEVAISLDPALRDAYVMLAEIYDATGDRRKRRETLERYLRVVSQSLVVRKLIEP